MSTLLLLSAQQIALTLCRIAEMRVDAQTWDFIAARLQATEEEVRELVLLHEGDFRKRLRLARRDQREFDGDAAFKKLRQQMDWEDEKISHSAACTVAKLNVAEKRIRAMKAKNTPKAPAKPEVCPEGYLEIAKLSQYVRNALEYEKLSDEKKAQRDRQNYRFQYRYRYDWKLIDPQAEEPCPCCGILPSGVFPDNSLTYYLDEEARERALKNVAELVEAEKNGPLPHRLIDVVARSAMVYGGPKLASA